MELRDDGLGGVVRSGRLSAHAQLALIAVAATAVRLVLAGTIGLTEDEAYYRLWSQHLQGGYFDHPPMIAWWIRAGMMLAGDTPLGVRLAPTLATGLATWLLGDTALRLGLAGRVATRGALWWNATFTIGLGGLLATPDTPACFFWTLCVWSLARGGKPIRPLWWIAAGVAAGLCCLAKYSGLFLAPGVLLWLLLTPGGLNELKRPWPWLAGLAAALVFLPNVLWNAAHDWMTFDKQFGRAAVEHLRPERLSEFLLTQFVLLNPLIAALAARGVARASGGRRDPARVGLLLPLAVAAPFLLYLMAHSLHDRVQGHWPVPTFGALALAAAYAAETSRPWIRRAVPLLGLGLSALALLYLSLLPQPGFLGARDPARALRGWDAFAHDVEATRRREGAGWVGVISYGVLAQLSAQRRIQAPLIEIVERQRYFDWDRDFDARRPGLVLDLDRRVKEAELRRCFAVVVPAGVIDRGHSPGPVAHYAAYRVEGPKSDLLRQGCP